MPLTLWGMVIGVVLSVVIGVLWTAGGAGIALLVPVLALALGEPARCWGGAPVGFGGCGEMACPRMTAMRTPG